MHFILLFFSFCSSFLYGIDTAIELKQVHNQASINALPLLFCYAPAHDTELAQILEHVQTIMERSGQFSITLVPIARQVSTKEEINKFCKQGYPLTLFFNQSDDKKTIDWRLYDATQARMVKGKKLYKRGVDRSTVYNLADELWTELTYQPSSFSSIIAYVKRIKDKAGRERSIICRADFDGSHVKEIARTNSSYVGLYWHSQPELQRLFCSRFTRFNVQLCSIDLQGPQKVLFDFEGTCVGISLAPDSDKAVYCRSGVIWQYVFDRQLCKSRHIPLIQNEGKNSTPTLLPNGDVIFCSDAKSLKKNEAQAKGPQIYRYKAESRTIDPITTIGYCVGPAYCARTQKVAYSKRVDGVMQLCIYDSKTGNHEQITFDSGNKIDCCWSPCGIYLAYCYTEGKTHRIGVIHTLLKKRWFLTVASEYCAYPAWSPRFMVFPE